MRRAITIFALIIFAMNANLWANGEFNNAQFTAAYPGLPPGLQDINDINQSSLTLLDSDGNPISATAGSFIATQFDFLDPIQVLGAIFDLLNFVTNFVLNITMGITLLAIKFQAPINIVVFIGAVNFAVVIFGLMEVLAFVNSTLRGGSAA